MYKIYIIYDDKLIEDNKQFKNTVKKLKSIYNESISFEVKSEVKFQIIFNEKVIYSLDDSFVPNLLIDESVLKKINNYIENAIKLNKSKDISAVDDIWIDDI